MKSNIFKRHKQPYEYIPAGYRCVVAGNRLRQHMQPYEEMLRRFQNNDILRQHMLPYEATLGRQVNLSEMARNQMDTLVKSEIFDIAFVGYDPYDCVWRCIAWFQSGGSHYDEQAAFDVARAYYGESFNPASYGFRGSCNQLRALVAEYQSRFPYFQSSGRILLYEPYRNPDGPIDAPEGEEHAVVVLRDVLGGVEVFDPQHEKYYTVVNEASRCFVNVR